VISDLPLSQALSSLGYPEPLRRTSVGGGCISNGQKLEFPDGRALFLKQARGLPEGMFAKEAQGLAALREPDVIRVPQPLAIGSEEGVPFLLLEWIETGTRGPQFAERLGRRLADLHRFSGDGQFGFAFDNYIGSTPQPNGVRASWIEFFAERRLRFQLTLAAEKQRVDRAVQREIEQVIDRLPQLLPEPEQPSLLHGDLWGGNLMVDDHGDPVLIDPAPYFGHREADLAMTRLFGGFPSLFYASYQESWPLSDGFEERVDLYNLYHLLNHLNLFGSGYLSSVRSIAGAYA